MPIVRDLLMYFGLMTVVFSVASLPPSPPILLFAHVAPPWLLALIGSIAAGVAAVFDHYVVRRAFRISTLERARKHRFFELFERWAKVAPFTATLMFAALPLPFFLARILIPLSGYPVRRYAAAVALGRYPRVFVVATFGRAFEIPREILIGMLVFGVVAGGVSAIVRRVREKRELPK